MKIEKLNKFKINYDFFYEVKKYPVLDIKNDIDISEIEFYKIDEITYQEDDKYPRREAFENIISSFQLENLNIIYLIIGNEQEISFYIGISTDLEYSNEKPYSIIENLKKTIEGNFIGSKLSKIKNDEKIEILNKIKSLNKKNKNEYGIINGIPSILETKDNKDFQGIDRLVNSIQGKEFGIMILMKAIPFSEIMNLEERIFDYYTELNVIHKQSSQIGKNISDSLTENENKTESKSTSKSIGVSDGETKGDSKSDSINKSESVGKNYSETNGESKTETYSYNESKSDTSGRSETNTAGKNKNVSQYNNTNKSTGTNSSKSVSENTSSSTTKGEGKSDADSKSFNKTEGSNETKTEGITQTTGSSISVSKTKSITDGETDSKSISFGESKTKQTGSSQTMTVEYLNKHYSETLKYIDDVLLPMLDYSKGKGLYNVQIATFATNEGDLLSVSNSLKALASGKKGNKNPLRLEILNNELDNAQIKYIENFQFIKRKNLKIDEIDNQLPIMSYNNCMKDLYIYSSNFYSTNEISIIAGFPRREIVGLKLRKEVEFGLNYIENENKENDIVIGNLIQSGNVLNKEIKLNKLNFDRHIFVSGVTGTGKTTTCQKLLYEANYPFLVIEPAKTEYRGLKKDDNFKDMLVFTLGDDNVSPFRMNPFELLGPDKEYDIEAESIVNRIDLLKGAILSSFDTEAAIPQIIEDILYEAYKKKGWNVETNENNMFDNPYDKNVDSFPTMKDVLNLVGEVVDSYGFDDRLKNDYKGSINARLKTFTQGVKGQMLCTKRGVNFEDLLERKVVFEIENIKNGAEKSFVMALILININEAIRRKYKRNPNFRHITLIEEAHRLLSKVEYGNESKKEGIEMFTDMLAEVRKYGECLIIADQIPNKLTSEVLKNTNTKIIHKLFSADDKKAIGSTMSFDEKQEDFLSNLIRGRAIIFSEGWDTPLQVQIKKFESNSNLEIKNEELRKDILDYYKKEENRHIIENLEIFDFDVEKTMLFNKEKYSIVNLFFEEIMKSSYYEEYKLESMRKYIQYYGRDNLKKILSKNIYDKLIKTVYGNYLNVHSYDEINVKNKFLIFCEQYVENVINTDFDYKKIMEYKSNFKIVFNENKDEKNKDKIFKKELGILKNFLEY